MNVQGPRETCRAEFLEPIARPPCEAGDRQLLPTTTHPSKVLCFFGQAKD